MGRWAPAKCWLNARPLPERETTATPVLELPPRALRLFAEMLGIEVHHQPVLMLQNHELTAQDSAALLSGS